MVCLPVADDHRWLHTGIPVLVYRHFLVCKPALRTLPIQSVHRTPPSALAPRVGWCGDHSAVWQGERAPWYALACTAGRDPSGPHEVRHPQLRRSGCSYELVLMTSAPATPSTWTPTASPASASVSPSRIRSRKPDRRLSAAYPPRAWRIADGDVIRDAEVGDQRELLEYAGNALRVRGRR